MKHLGLLPILLIVCINVWAMSPEPAEKSEILYFNIGGAHFDIARSDVEKFGGSYLNALINGKFAITKDDDGRIFISRCKSEGELVATFIQSRCLPGRFDKIIARNAAAFFDIEPMAQYIKKHRRSKQKIHQKLSSQKSIIVETAQLRHNTCLECSNTLANKDNSTFLYHLLNDHHATIDNIWHAPHTSVHMIVCYRVPLE